MERREKKMYFDATGWGAVSCHHHLHIFFTPEKKEK
jgi:hypothetical protein